MADDIDIEEHDVLESLRRRQGPASPAPDPPAARVKSEPLDIEYDPHYEESGDFEYNWGWDKNATEIKIEPLADDDVPFGKIILGSKPATPPPRDPQGPPADPEEYNYNMSLVLDDWGPILDRSECYCQECQILFATVNALDAHKMIAHSFLVAIDKKASPERNKAFKSTAKLTIEDKQTCGICHFHFKGITGKSNLKRHYRDVHQVDPDTLEGKKDFKSWRVCNHCNLYFPNDTSLVKHLYELLPLNNKTPTKDDRKSVGQRPQAKPVFNLDKSKNAKSINITHAKSNVAGNDTKQANRIILGSKPMSAKTEEVDDKWRCSVCGIQYSKKYYQLHMRKFHPDIALDKGEKSPDKIILKDTNVRYKCILCSQILLTNYLAHKHRAKHPGMKRRKIFVKLVKSNKVKSNVITPTKVYKKEPKSITNAVDEDQGILVSKSILFKCNRCSVHFLTCTGACQHSIVCETSSNIRDWECPQCLKVFKSAERSAHEYQHKMLSANKVIKVYVVYLEMIVRVLCECPHCFVCFEEDKFWKHVNQGCNHNAESYYCSECRLRIDAHSKANHDSKHKQGDFTKDDFIKIDYVSSKKVVPKIKNEIDETPRRGRKRKLEMTEVPQKKGKRTDEFHLFYCSFCKLYLGTKVDFHVSGKCKDKKRNIRGFCKICGINFSVKHQQVHKKLHEKHPNLKLSDFTLMRMSDSKKIRPQPEMYPCKACDVNFLTKFSRYIHKCKNTASVNCSVCQKKIQKEIYKTHMQIHSYVIPGKVKSIDQKVKITATPAPQARKDIKSPILQRLLVKESKPPVTKLPDLLMKYQSLTALWNILYLCATCDTFTDSYDKVVEHCQNHLTNMENYGVVIMKCQICDMTFDSECYRRHLELHAGNKIINKKTFQILKYEYFNLFSRDWFSFIDLPDEQKSQIVNRSIYGENRCVKMRLLQQGPPECTMYKCSKCLNCVAADTIVHHVKLANCLKANKVACSICDMTFAVRSQCEQHELIHKATGLGAESFRIVAFNDAADTETNLNIMSYDTDNHGSRSKILFADDDVVSTVPESTNNKGKSKNFVFYKCSQCHVCLVHLSNFRRHVCRGGMKKECSRCGLLFSVKYYRIHGQLHNKYSFSRKNVITKTVNKEGKVVNIIKQSQDKGSVMAAQPKLPNQTQPKTTEAQLQAKNSKLTEEKPKLFKCYCGLHFTSLKTIEKHYKMKNCSTVIREKCSQCNLIFDPIEVVNHLCKHHAQGPVRSFDVVTPNKKTLYKCGVCHVLFYNRHAAALHQGKCGGKHCGNKCDKCGLAFDAISLATHLVDHERNARLRTDCYVIVKIPDETVQPVNKKISPNTLYWCKICDIHFLRRSSARNHLTHGSHGHTKSQKCKICQLGFLPKTMGKHVAWQHQKLKIKEFDIKELIVGHNTKTPKGKNQIVVKTYKVSKPSPKKSTTVEAAAQKLKPVAKVEAKQVQRKVTVHRCSKCALHFTNAGSLLNHHDDRCSKELSEECEECAVRFASKNIKEHKKLHGPGIVLTLNILADGKTVEAVTKPERSSFSLDTYDNKLYKCTECKLYYNSKTTLLRHPTQCNPDAAGLKILKCEICDLEFTKYSLNRHTLIHKKYNFKKEDFVILTLADIENSDPKIKKEPDEHRFEEDTMVAFDSTLELESTDKETAKVKASEPKVNTHMLCKCADCNVYFVTQRACHKHIAQHTPFDSKDYIECKLCGFQFTIMTLPIHIKKHHETQFNLEEVLVEEYQPNDVKSCETYYASEKDQSRLVTTSDDVKNVANSEEEHDNEVTSCNQVESCLDESQTDPQAGVDVSDHLKVPTESSSSDGNVNVETDGNV